MCVLKRLTYLLVKHSIFMKEHDTKNILNIYFGKLFSERGRILFGRWLRAEDATKLKEEALHVLWENNSVQPSAATHEDWNKLQKRLYTVPIIRTSASFWRHIVQYSAVAVFTLLLVSTAFLLADRVRSPKHVHMSEYFVPYGESRLITLPDSSTVFVDAGSLLIYPTDFVDMDTRSVYLTGKASFTIRENKEKPFIVKTTYLNVEALGTTFTVKSYPTDLYTTATLESGSIRVDMKGGDIPSSLLKPNEQLVYYHKEHTVYIHMVDASIYEMERQGYLIFNNASFEQLMASLERKYNLVIQYNSQKYAKECYNVKFAPNESIEDVFDVLQQLTGLNYRINKSVVIIN